MAYDGYKDLYKLFVDGIKITSGSWTGDKSLEPVRFVDGIKITSGSWTGDKSVEPVRHVCVSSDQCYNNRQTLGRRRPPKIEKK